MPKTKVQPDHCSPRVSALRKRMKAADCEALLITNPVDIRYLTGFIGEDSWALVRAKSAKLHVLSDRRFEEEIKRDAPQVTAIMRTKSLSESLKQLFEKLKLKSIALQEDYVTISQRAAIVKQIKAKAISSFNDDLLMQRSVKDEAELDIIKQATRIAEKAYELTLKTIEVGQSEYEIAATLEYNMRLLGADGPSFQTIVAVDGNAALPHARPGEAQVKRGSLILIDWGARYKGYCSDLTRCIGVGKMPAKMREVYKIVLEAQLAGIDAIAAGKTGVEVDKAARDIIDKAGYGKEFGHSLGHGIGLDIHEQPTLSSRSEGKLKADQVVTVEPGIYLPGVGGIRIEDDVRVTDTGRRIISRLPKDLESAII